MTETEQTTIDYSGAREIETSGESLGDKFILFEIAGQLGAVPAASVLEVVHSLSTTVIPNSPEWLLGLSIFRGEPVAIIRPHAVLQRTAGLEPSNNFKSIIFRGRDDEAQVALPVDRINEMFVVPDTNKSTSDSSERVDVMRNGVPVDVVDIYSFIDKFKKEAC